ncbi:hypothetical protein FRC09_016766 [Ceratobasidium sp. 395]|nr:hypothetical protein FRC09_016766 [Ceratobasidium sp. 395]
MPAIGAELDKDAQVWEVYVDETDRSDKELVKSWNELVVESSKRLQPDPAETSAQTLQVMSQILIAISNGKPFDSSTSSGVLSSRLPPSRLSVLVNGLWFLSLALSVTVSLVAMVSKSWCNVFMSNRSGPKYDQGRRRQQKWNAVETWGMEDVFVYLPTLMHLALLDWTAVLRRLVKAARILPLARQGSRDLIHSPGHQPAPGPESTPMDKVTCLMLLWLIRNCEDSQLVDMALQSIAGARPGLPGEMLAEADVARILVQRLNNCLMYDSRTKTISFKPAASVEAAGLYARALTRVLECDAGFGPSSKYQVPQLDRKHLDTFFNPDMDKIYFELQNRIFINEQGEDKDFTTIATSIAAPLCYHESTSSLSKTVRGSSKVLQSSLDRLLRSHLNRGVAIDSRALLASLEVAPHWMIRQVTSMNKKRRNASIMLLVQLLRFPSCSAPDFQYAIGLSLTVVTFLMHDYPGWEHPLNSIEDRATRAIEVYRHYKVEHREEPKVLIVSGLLGLLRGVLEEQETFQKDEAILFSEVLTHIGDFHSIATYRLHTFPDTLTIAQHTKTTLLETLQVVVDGRSDFGETALIPCLTQLLLQVDALRDSNIGGIALKAFLSAQNSRLRRICSEPLLKCSGFYRSLEAIELVQMSGLIDISLGKDAYSAPTAMICLWNLTEQLIKAVNTTSDERLATVLADMLKHDAFASLRAMAPNLPVSPKNMFELGFADMWYPLLKEMTSHQYAASIVGESEILVSMRYSHRASDAIPYMGELRDGRSWYDMITELDDISRTSRCRGPRYGQESSS